MGKIICEECGKEFDDTNEVCPNCGYKRNKKKIKLKFIIPIIIVIVIAIGISLLIVIFNRKDTITDEVIEEEISIVELIEQAEILDMDEIEEIRNENKARAEDYNDIWYIYLGKVEYIYADFCLVTCVTCKETYSIDVYFEKEVLKTLNEDENIVILGKFSNLQSFDTIYKMQEAVKVDTETALEYLVMEKISMKSGNENYPYNYSDYVYDNTIEKIVSYSYTNHAAENGTHDLTYDDNGNLIKDTTTSKSGSISYAEYTYNDENILTFVTECSSSITKVFEVTCEQDDNGNIIKKTLVNTAPDTDYTIIYEYEYNENDLVSTETQTTSSSVYTITYEYDNFNNVTESISREQGGGSTTKTYKYSIVAKK